MSVGSGFYDMLLAGDGYGGYSMTSVTVRTCDSCGKELDREFAHVHVQRDDRKLVYYSGPHDFDYCISCWGKAVAALKEA